MNVAIITIETLTKLFAARIELSSLSGFEYILNTVEALAVLALLSLSVSEVLSEKYATSEPLINADIIKRKAIKTNPMIISRLIGFTRTPEKRPAAERGSSGSKINGFYWN